MRGTSWSNSSTMFEGHMAVMAPFLSEHFEAWWSGGDLDLGRQPLPINSKSYDHFPVISLTHKQTNNKHTQVVCVCCFFVCVLARLRENGHVTSDWKTKVDRLLLEWGNKGRQTKTTVIALAKHKAFNNTLDYYHNSKSRFSTVHGVQFITWTVCVECVLNMYLVLYFRALMSVIHWPFCPALSHAILSI